MMKVALPILFMAAGLIGATQAGASSSGPIRVDARYLMQHKSEYVGKAVSIHACWAWPAPHGSIIFPCGDLEDADAIRVDYPETGKDFLAEIYIKRLHADVTRPVEARFVGTITQEAETILWGTSRKKVLVDYLLLQHVLNPKIYRKH